MYIWTFTTSVVVGHASVMWWALTPTLVTSWVSAIATHAVSVCVVRTSTALSAIAAKSVPSVCTWVTSEAASNAFVQERALAAHKHHMSGQR